MTTPRPKSFKDDKEYLEWFKSLTDFRVVAREIVDMFHMFYGDSYYHDFQDAARDKLETFAKGVEGTGTYG